MFKRLILLVLIFSLALSVGCVKNNTDEELTEQSVSNNPINDKPGTVLSLFTDMYVADDKMVEMINNVAAELNHLSMNTLNVTVNLMTQEKASALPYTANIEILRESGETPDILMANGLHLMNVSATIVNLNDLVYFQSQGIATDLNDYINEQTPYITELYKSYPAFYDLSCIDNKLLGIIIPDTIVNSCPIVAISKSLCEKYSINSVTEFLTAFELCKTFSQDEKSKIYLEPSTVLSCIVKSKGLYNMFPTNLPYMYYGKYEDSEINVFRIDKTDLWDSILSIKEDILTSDFQISDTNMENLIEDFKAGNVSACLLRGLGDAIIC